MEYICYNMNAYNLHIVNTKKFKTITVDICFREKINKDENFFKDLNEAFSSGNINTENLTNLGLLSDTLS